MFRAIVPDDAAHKIKSHDVWYLGKFGQTDNTARPYQSKQLPRKDFLICRHHFYNREQIRLNDRPELKNESCRFSCHDRQGEKSDWPLTRTGSWTVRKQAAQSARCQTAKREVQNSH